MFRAAGVVLVAGSILAASGRLPAPSFLLASVVWLACTLRLRLRQPPGGRWVLVVALLLRIPFLFSGYCSNDLYRYVWEGKIQWEGVNPYAQAPADPALAHLRGPDHEHINHPELTAIYPPGAQLFFAAATGLGLHEKGLRGLVLLLDMAVVAALLAWLRSTGRPPGWGLIYAWSPLAVSGAAVGHYDPLMLLFLVLVAWSWERGRVLRAAVFLGGAILAKTVAVLLLPWLLVRKPRAALLGVVPIVLLGYLPYLSGNPFSTLYKFGADYAFNGSLFSLAHLAAPAAARWIVAGLLAAWVAWVTFSQPRLPRAGAALFAGLLLLSPTVHFWYLTWFLVLLAAVGPRRGSAPLLLWCVTIVCTASTYRAPYAGRPFVEHFGLTALEYAPVYLLGAWLLLRAWPRRAPVAVAQLAARPPGEFTVIIPCRGEYANLETLVPAWIEAGAKKVILADTPTGDPTPSLAGGRVEYLPVRVSGYGAAVQAGLRAARDVEFAIVCDADHALGPGQVGALLAPFRDPRVGLVTSARPKGSDLSLPQRFGNGLATFLIGLGWGRRFHDLGPFRALRRNAWPEGLLRDPGFGWNVEMNVRALELGIGVVEVALPAGRRLHGTNRISGTLRGVLGAGIGILREIHRLKETPCAPRS